MKYKPEVGFDQNMKLCRVSKVPYDCTYLDLNAMGLRNEDLTTILSSLSSKIILNILDLRGNKLHLNYSEQRYDLGEIKGCRLIRLPNNTPVNINLKDIAIN